VYAVRISDELEADVKVTQPVLRPWTTATAKSRATRVLLCRVEQRSAGAGPPGVVRARSTRSHPSRSEEATDDG
jgi:hypothetical protein